MKSCTSLVSGMAILVLALMLGGTPASAAEYPNLALAANTVDGCKSTFQNDANKCKLQYCYCMLNGSGITKVETYCKSQYDQGCPAFLGR